MQNVFQILHFLKESKIVESPEWHRDFLRNTERRLELGEEKAVDWNAAKNELRKRFK